eukprot:Pgem_evm1s7897
MFINTVLATFLIGSVQPAFAAVTKQNLYSFDEVHTCFQQARSNALELCGTSYACFKNSVLTQYDQTLGCNNKKRCFDDCFLLNAMSTSCHDMSCFDTAMAQCIPECRDPVVCYSRAKVIAEQCGNNNVNCYTNNLKQAYNDDCQGVDACIEGRVNASTTCHH